MEILESDWFFCLNACHRWPDTLSMQVAFHPVTKSEKPARTTGFINNDI